MTITKKQTIKVITTLLVVFTIFATGCTNNTNNQMRQQGVTRQSVPNKAKTNMGEGIQIASNAANRIVQLYGVKQANVLITRRNAYVAAVLDVNQGQLTRKLEDSIAQQVRTTDPYVQNVYVSTNPEFVDHINRYVSDIRQGRPVSGFIQEFNDIVQRIFPNAR